MTIDDKSQIPTIESKEQTFLVVAQDGPTIVQEVRSSAALEVTKVAHPDIVSDRRIEIVSSSSGALPVLVDRGTPGPQGPPGLGFAETRSTGLATGFIYIVDSPPNDVENVIWSILVTDPAVGVKTRMHLKIEAVSIANNATVSWFSYGRIGDSFNVSFNVRVSLGGLRLDITQNHTGPVDVTVLRIATEDA